MQLIAWPIRRLPRSSFPWRRLLAICFVSVFRYRRSFSFLLNLRCCTLWPVGEGVLAVIFTARTSPSLGGVVYDVHDCFVDRHKKKLAPSKGQAWWLNRSPCNSGKCAYSITLWVWQPPSHVSGSSEICTHRTDQMPTSHDLDLSMFRRRCRYVPNVFGL